MKIALTNTGDVEKHGYYVQWLQQQNDDIEILKLDETFKNAHLLDQSDALVLSGGVDIHPSIYRGHTSYAHAPKSWYRERDEFEMALFKKARDRDMPILAVCRGLQLVNVALGGTLIQDLGEAGDKVHEAGHEDKRHRISIEPGTLLHELAGGSADINSAHHQAIDKPGAGLLVNARATDGTIEGIEWINKARRPFLLGVQWHPERMFMMQLGQSPASKNIRDRFIDEIKKSNALQL